MFLARDVYDDEAKRELISGRYVRMYPFPANMDITLADWTVYITSRAYATMLVSVCLSVTEVNWRIIANLGFKFRSKFTRIVVAGRSHLNNNISRYASHC